MAARKTTSKTKPRKTTAKKNEKIRLTYRPIASAARVYVCRLVKKEWQDRDGRRVEVTVPRIEGLPTLLEVKKDEVIEVTQSQLEQLQECGFVETQEEYEARQKFVDNLDPQHPDTLTFDQLSGKGQKFMTVRESIYVYNDKLIRV